MAYYLRDDSPDLYRLWLKGPRDENGELTYYIHMEDTDEKKIRLEYFNLKLEGYSPLLACGVRRWTRQFERELDAIAYEERETRLKSGVREIRLKGQSNGHS